MKKFILMTLSAAMIFTISGCGSEPVDEGAPTTPAKIQPDASKPPSSSNPAAQAPATPL